MENLEKALHINNAIDELYSSSDDDVTVIDQFNAIYSTLNYIDEIEAEIEAEDALEFEEEALDSSAVESEFNEFSPSVMEEAIYQRPHAVLEYYMPDDEVSWYDGCK